MKKRMLILSFVLGVFLLTNNCTEESNPIDPNTPVIDPITNTWTVQSDSSYTIFFVTYDSSATRGVFWGTEEHPTEGSHDLCGFFDGTYLEFDVQRPFGSRTKFSGKFIDSNRMEISSSEGPLVLTR